MELPPTVEPQPAAYYRKKAAARFYIQAVTDEFFGVPGESNGCAMPALVIYWALVQIAGTSRQSLLRCAMFRPEAPRSRLQVQLGLERRDVAVRTVPCGCGVAARCRRS